MSLSIKNIYESTKWSEEQINITPIKRYTNNKGKLSLWPWEFKLHKTYTMRVWDVKSLNPVLYLKQNNAKTTTNPTHILFKDFTAIKRYTNNIGKLNLWLSEFKLHKTYTLGVWGVMSLNPVLYLKQNNAKKTTNPTHVLFKDITAIKRYTNNIVKLNLWLWEFKLHKNYTLRVWGVMSLNAVLYLKQNNAKNDH